MRAAELLFGRKDMTSCRSRSACRHGVQSYALFPICSSAEQYAYGLKIGDGR